jgi:Flp pilus assembly protein TadG
MIDSPDRGMRQETGQVLVLMALLMVILVGFTAFAVDVGHAYLVQRQLQAGVDAAALAAAQEIPDAAAVIAAGSAYGPSTGARNATTTVDGAVTSIQTKCLTSAPGCSSRFGSFNAVQVTATAAVPTYFARVFGIDAINVDATATACSPCTAKPLDVMVVLDRTGSMCQVGNGQSDAPQCTDLANAKEGVRTFLEFMDPTIDRVGLAVFPPALDRSTLCVTPNNGPQGSRYGYDAYWPEWIPDPRGKTPGIYAIGSLVSDYLVRSGNRYVLNPASSLLQYLDCVRAAGTTSYSNAIIEAQYELFTHGRGNVQDVIIFLSDGAANTTPRFTENYLDNPTDRARPCGSGIKAAAQVKAGGTLIYSIGYDLNGQGTDYERCRNPNNGADEGISAFEAMQQIASDRLNFYNKPDPGQLNTIFTEIARDINRPSARLIDDSST